MITNNTFLYSAKIILEFLRDIVYFPLWWFTLGLLMIIQKNAEYLKNRQKALGLFIWTKNIFTPMYGQRDWQGRLISFFMRLFQIFVRALAMLIFVTFSVFFVLLWVVFPFIVIYEILFQLYPDTYSFIISLFTYAE